MKHTPSIILDDPSTSQLAFMIGGGVLLSALYHALHSGLAALGDGALHAQADSGSPFAKTAKRAVENRSSIRTRLRIGRGLGLGLATIAGYVAGDAYAIPVALGVAAGTMLVSELGGAVARRRAHRAAMRMLRWCRPLEWLMAPLAAPIEWLADSLEMSIPAADPLPETTARAVEELIDRGAKEGGLGSAHAELLLNALEFRDTITREVMVPRTQLVGFAIETELSEVLARIVETGHSRYPVYRETLDEIVGLLYAKDLFSVLGEGLQEDASLQALVRRPVFMAQEGKKVGALLREMQAHRFHMAVVVDEFGGVSGLVTLEDILEELVGEIADEHDDDEDPIQELASGHYYADASVSVYDLEDRLGEEIPGSEDQEYASLGGMIIKLAGGVPAPGDELTVGSLHLRILEADERHVTRVEITRRAEVA